MDQFTTSSRPFHLEDTGLLPFSSLCHLCALCDFRVFALKPVRHTLYTLYTLLYTPVYTLQNAQSPCKQALVTLVHTCCTQNHPRRGKKLFTRSRLPPSSSIALATEYRAALPLFPLRPLLPQRPRPP